MHCSIPYKQEIKLYIERLIIKKSYILKKILFL